MKRPLTASAAAFAVIALAAAALAAEAPKEVPFPSAKVDVFVHADTVTAPTSALGPGVLTSSFARGATVAFRMFAGDVKTGKVLTDRDVRYAYLKIPGQPNVKLAFGKQGTDARAPWFWTATWTVPADYALGVVPFQVLIKTKANKYGSFQQAPVASAQLTVTKV